MGELPVSADPIRYQSLLPYYVLMFAVLVTWMIIGEGVSQYGLLAVVSNPMSWVQMATAVMGVMLVPVALLSWRMKQQVSVDSPDWRFIEQEVEYTGFQTLLRKYYRAYSHLMNHVSWIAVAITSGLASAAIVLPYAVAVYTPAAIVYASSLFALLLLPFGLLAGRAVYMAVSNDACLEFPRISSRNLWKAVELLEEASGFSWAGVRLSIGEAAGYFTLRKPRAVGRIEGIESSAWIEIIVDESGFLTDAIARVALRSKERELRVPASKTGALARSDLEDLARACLREYVSDRGSNELLDGVMEDLGMQINGTMPRESGTTQKGDALISDSGNQASDREDDVDE